MLKIILISLLLPLTSALAAVEMSPFTDVSYEQAPSVSVEYNGESFLLLAVNGMKRADIMTKCANVFGADCNEKFALNFLELMNAIGAPVTGDTVSLKLYKFAAHQVLEVEEAMLSEENVEDIRFNRELRGD